MATVNATNTKIQECVRMIAHHSHYLGNHRPLLFSNETVHEHHSKEVNYWTKRKAFLEQKIEAEEQERIECFAKLDKPVPRVRSQNPCWLQPMGADQRIKNRRLTED